MRCLYLYGRLVDEAKPNGFIQYAGRCRTETCSPSGLCSAHEYQLREKVTPCPIDS